VVSVRQGHRGGAPREGLAGAREASEAGAEEGARDEGDHREREREEGPPGGGAHWVVG